MSSLEIPRFRR